MPSVSVDARVHLKWTKAMCFRQTQHTSAVVMVVVILVITRGDSVAHEVRILMPSPRLSSKL